MSIWSKIKKFRIKDAEFQNVPPRTAFIVIIFGIVNFLTLGSILTDILRIRDFNWGIYKGLGFADSFQVPILTGIVIFNAGLMFFGLWLYKHRELTEEEQKKNFRRKYGSDEKTESDDNNDLQ